MSTPSTTSTFPMVCWSCQERTQGTHVCSNCGKIQQLPRNTDYFVFFGLPRKLRIDSGGLEKRFHELSWKLHPDNFVNATPQERELALQLSSQLNDAYRALREPVSRVEYLLATEGMRKEGQHKQQAPPELLEEVFELNESLEELRSAQAGEGDTAPLRARLAAAGKHFEQKLGEVDVQLAAIFGEWDAALDSGAGDDARKNLMSRMNELLNRRSYIRNLVANVQKEL
ncbi:MAG TPA: Fe-S protein assembly co-chaperone HscB [Candidatus Acidoferrales bacterium]|nr:Fe-S protein assembly co-chaperone HscB [Candidatus Acidoferrales bacterium]